MTRLFVSDLDGTLADRDARLTAFTRSSLRRLLGQGLPFTVATARSHTTLSEIMKGVPITLPVIEFNGAFLTDFKTGESFHCESLLPEVAAHAVKLGSARHVMPFVSTYTGGAQRLYPPPRLANAGMKWLLEARLEAKDRRLRAAEEPRRAVEQTTVCLTFISDRETLEELRGALESECPGSTNSVIYRNSYDPDWHWLTVQSRRANKATALAWLAEHVGVPLADVTVFGDEVNDIEMFDVAGTSVAVENAVPELKQRATRVIGAHDSDSVAQYLIERSTQAESRG